MANDLPFRVAAEVTPETATNALRQAGLLGSRGELAAVAVEPIGTGQMADSLRLSLTYADAVGEVGDERSEAHPKPPRSIVAKLTSSDERSRMTGRAMRSYEIEVGFYRELANTVDIRTPRCYLARFDPDTHDFVLLLEDLAPARQRDQIEGCDADVAARVLEQAAGLAAPRWNDPDLRKLGWLDRATPESAAVTSSVVGSMLDGFLARYGDLLTAEVIDGLERGMARVGDWWRGLPGAQTVVHGDLRLDNLLLGDAPDAVWTVDWQTAVLGNGVADAAYFLGGSLPTEVRRAHEDDLVRHYHESLVARGVADLSWDECWARYRHGAWHGVYMCVGAAMMVRQTERGDRMFLTNTDRHVRHVLDLDAFDVFDLADRGLPGGSASSGGAARHG